MPVDIRKRLVAAVTAKAAALDLTGINSVAAQMFPDIKALSAESLPALCVSQEDIAARRLSYTSQDIMWLRPVRLWLIDVDPAHSKVDGITDTLDELAAAFDAENGRMEEVPEVQWCEIDHEVTFNPDLPQYRHVISGLTLWFTTHEAR